MQRRKARRSQTSFATAAVVAGALPANAARSGAAVQCRFAGGPPQSACRDGGQRPTSGALPAGLRNGLERLSGFDMSPVRVHYNSPRPAQVGALAYAQGNDIHLARGQEKHLPHEGWHVVQQMQGRVSPTTQYKGVAVNDNTHLEREADVMGQQAAQTGGGNNGGLALTRAPATGAAVQGVMQRVIDFSTSSVRLGTVANIEQLIVAAQGLFPRLPNIADIVGEIQGQSLRWTLHEVYTVLNQRAALIPEPISTGELEDIIMMPSKQSYSNDFGFTTKTRARGRIDRRSKSPVPLRDSAQKNSRFHAEDDLMEQLDDLLYDHRVNNRDTIYITINNSPCLERCAPNLAKWYERYWRGRMVIRYANPYGSTSEFIRARKMLRDAGIEINSFPAERYVKYNSLSVKQRERFDKMRNRRREYRRIWNKKYPDDMSEGSDEERGRSRSPSPERSSRRRSFSDSRSPSPERSTRKRSSSDRRSPSPEPRESRLRIPGRLHNVSGDGMDCLIRAVLYAALGNINEDTVTLIRNHLVGQHVAVHGSMLNLAGLAGSIMITFMTLNGILGANRGIVVYTPGQYGGVVSHTVLPGVNPIRLWLSDDHFQAIV